MSQANGNVVKGINPKFKVMDMDESESNAKYEPTSMTNKIPFHHPRLSGSWAHSNNAMVI
jgi:hypothetical protein